MPIYDLKCGYCGHVFEEIISFDAIKDVECPKCHTKENCRVNIPTSVGIKFKGSGFYRTDYKDKGL